MLNTFYKWLLVYWNCPCSSFSSDCRSRHNLPFVWNAAGVGQAPGGMQTCVRGGVKRREGICRGWKCGKCRSRGAGGPEKVNQRGWFVSVSNVAAALYLHPSSFTLVNSLSTEGLEAFEDAQMLIFLFELYKC